MCSEFLRLTEVNAVDSLQALLQKHGQSIVSIVDSCGKALPPLLNDHLEAMKAAKSEETERGCLILCFCFFVVNSGVITQGFHSPAKVMVPSVL